MTSIEEAIRSGAVRLVPVEAIEAMAEKARGDDEYAAGYRLACTEMEQMSRERLGYTPALVALIEERDRLKVELDGAREALSDAEACLRLERARALAAEAECDALREAMAAEREACAAFVEAEAKHLPGGVCDLKATCRYLANEIRARALTQETNDGE